MLLLQAVGALAASADGGVVGQMAEEVERIGVGLAGLDGEGAEIDAALGKLVEDDGPGFGLGPAGAQVFGFRAYGTHVFGGEVGQLFHPDLFAVGIELVDEFGGDFHAPAVEVELAALRVGRIDQDVATLADGRLGGLFAGFRREDFFLLRPAVLVDFLLRGEGGIAVEGRVGEIAGGGAGVIEDVEEILLVIGADAGAAADDLLELDHGIDEADERHVAAGGGVEAGSEQLRGRQDDRLAGFHVLEPLHVAAADVAFVGGDAADVVGVVLDEVGVEVDEGRAHFGGVFLVHAEHDGLGETIGFLEKIGQMAGDGLRAGAQGHAALEVGGGIDFVGDFAAVAVEVALAGAPTGGIPLGHDAMDAVGGEKAVVDALAEAVGIDGVAEIEVGVAVVGAQGRGGHAELAGGGEVFEDFAPVGFVLGGAAMAFVHDDEIEEVGFEFLVEAGAALVLGDGLVSGEVEFAAVDDPAAFDAVAGVAEGGEHLVLGIIDEEIAVGQIEDAGLAGRVALHVPLGFPKLPADLEGDEGLAGAGGHGEEHALLATQNGGKRAIHGDLLVVARNLAGFDVGRSQELPFPIRRFQAEGAFEPGPKVGGRRQFGEGGFLALQEVELDDAFAVGGVGKLEVEHLRVFLGLLQAGGGRFVQRLGFDHGQHGAGWMAQKVIRALGSFAPNFVAGDHDAAIGEGALFENLLVGPAGGVELGQDELPAGVSFGDHR